MTPNPWPHIGRRLADAGVPFLPVVVGGPHGLPMAGRDGMPLYIYAEHRDLPHWTACNDAR